MQDMSIKRLHHQPREVNHSVDYLEKFGTTMAMEFMYFGQCPEYALDKLKFYVTSVTVAEPSTLVRCGLGLSDRS